MKKMLLISVVFLFVVLNAQVGVNTNTPHPSAMLDVESLDKGFLPPRLASDADVNDPADGLVIYDESDDCLNVFDGNDWVNLCDLGSGGSGGSGGGTAAGGQGNLSWATPLRFNQVLLPFGGISTSMVTATSTDGNAYAWGYENRNLIRNFTPSTDASVSNTSAGLPASPFDDYLTSPVHIDDPAFNGKVKLFLNCYEFYAILTTDGEVYTFGFAGDDLQSVGVTGNSYLRKSRLMTLPAASSTATVVDMRVSREAIYIITSDGKAYWKGDGMGGLIDSSSWREIAHPTGAAPTFKYTVMLNKYNAIAKQVFLKGNDDNVYGTGGSNDRMFGANYNASTTDPTDPSGIVRIDFPAGVAEKVIKIKDDINFVAAVTNDGEIYAWGGYSGNDETIFAFKVDPSAPAPTLETWNSTRKYIEVPTKVALPPGETSLRDITFDNGNSFNIPTIVVGGSGKTYAFGGDLAGPFLMVKDKFPGMNDYTEVWSTSGFLASQCHISGDMFGYLDENGQYFQHGDIDNTGGFNTFRNSNSFKSPIAIPITNGNLDPTNPNP